MNNSENGENKFDSAAPISDTDKTEDKTFFENDREQVIPTQTTTERGFDNNENQNISTDNISCSENDVVQPDSQMDINTEAQADIHQVSQSFSTCYSQHQTQNGSSQYGQQQPQDMGNFYGQQQVQNSNTQYSQQSVQDFTQPYGQQQAQYVGGIFNQQQMQNGESPCNQKPFQQIQNPYADPQDYKNQQPTQVQYLPYTPDVVLPPGVKPEFINGGWYYPYVAFTNGKPKKKKMAASLKALIGIIIILTIAFVGIFIYWTYVNFSNSSSNGDGDNNLFSFEWPTEKATTKKSSEEVGKYANPDGPEIKLEDNTTINGSTEKAYETLSDSVVSVSVYNENDEPTNSIPNSEGTGIIISKDGYIVTNSHVINDTTEGYNVWITKKDGSTFPAVIVGCDTRTDLAVLLCEEAQDWQPASFANSDNLKVGQDVVAIGSPGGSSYSNSLTRGVISALNRTLSGNAGTYIQTDAAINPGNSGGPLANMNGQVIGINTIKVVDTEYEGMGFAIPSTQIKKVVDQLIKNGYVPGRARLGIVGKELSKSMAKYYGMSAGIIINTIDNDSPLKGTKVEEGDVITKIDDTDITSFAELFGTLEKYEEGDVVKLTICRYDDSSESSEVFTVEVTLIGDDE